MISQRGKEQRWMVVRERSEQTSRNRCTIQEKKEGGEMFTRRKRFKLDGGDVDKIPPPKDPGGEALTNIEIVNSSENGTPLKNPWVETLCKQPLPPPDYQEGETLSEGGKEDGDYDKEQDILKR